MMRSFLSSTSRPIINCNMWGMCVHCVLLHCVITIVVRVGRRRRRENTHLVMLVLLRWPSTAHLLVVVVAAAVVGGGRRGWFATLASVTAIPSSIARSISSQRSVRCGSNNASRSINTRRTSARSTATWPFAPEWTAHREATVAVVLIVSPLLVTASTANAN